jgi:hypothetical protein
MGFDASQVEDLLVKCRRHCCVCRRFKGVLIEVHHIDPSVAGGTDDIGNAIPLCSDCHAMIGHYNNAHPRGRKYRPRELARLRDEFIVLLGGMTKNITEPSIPGVVQTVVGSQNTVIAGDFLAGRKVVRQSFSPTAEHIEESTAFQIKTLVDEIASLDSTTRRPPANPHQKWWAKLKSQFNVAGYRAIPRSRGEEVIAWLLQQKAMLRPKLRRASNGTWRKEIYAAVYARCGELGIDKPALYELAQTKLGLASPVRSLTELGEQNLQRLHQIVFALKRP